MSRSRERLIKLLEEKGFEPKKSLGQNFLISDVVIERIIQATQSFEAKELIEIGPGPGSLTASLVKLNVPIKVIELDRGWAEYWREQKLEVIEQDALQVSWEKLIHDETVLVSNLPYQISSTLVIDRSMDSKPLKAMVLMFQKEVAQKIRGTPKDELYGFLSVIAQSFWKIETVTEAGPRDFLPPPKVASRVLKFTPLPAEQRPESPEKYLQFVKMAFQQRRKTLRSNWEAYLNQKKTGLWTLLLEEILKMGFTEKLRAEELSPIQFLRLWKLMCHDRPKA